MAKPPTAQQVKAALDEVAAGAPGRLKIVQVAYLTDWDAFNEGWRAFYATRPNGEDDPVVQYIRAEMGKLA